ncbi:hypothetical protein ACHAPE_009684 [Trichoderma viride]
MSPYSALLLAAAGLVAAEGLTAMNLGDVLGRGVTAAGLGSSAFGVHAVTGTCSIGETDCETGCMPLTGICCGLGNGAYCDIGYSCVSDGCCPVGKVCTGEPTGCEGDRDLCGEFCVPKGTCTSGGGGGGNGGGGSGGGDGSCPTGYEACDDACMPSGSVCCHNGYHCDAGQTCTADFRCQLGSGGGGGGGGSGGDGGDNQSSSPGDSFTSKGSSGSLGHQTSYSLSPNPEPTAAPTQSNPFGGSGGDDNTSNPFPPATSDDSQPSPTDTGSPFTSDAGPAITSDVSRPTTTAASRPTSTNGANGDAIGSSGLLVGLLAFIPFVL